MFRKLRIQLTLINVLVVSIISLFFLVGIYILTTTGLSRQAEQSMQLIATDTGSTAQPPTGHRNKYWYNYFYVKVNNAGQITETSQALPITPQQLKLLTTETLGRYGDRGKVDIYGEHQEYRFIKAPLKNGQGLTLVFLNTESEERIIGHLVGAFTVTGLGGIALTLFGSLFMAHRALIPIKNSWERQKNFVADASHELRTPLAVINTNLDVVKCNTDQTVASQIEWLENIQAESNLMIKLVDDLLFLARADSEQQLMNMDYFPLGSALKETMRPFEPVAAQQGLSLTCHIETDIDFFGDKTRIKQLVAILLDNAIKYTPAGGQVNLALRNLVNGIEITVSDTGEGIDKSHLSKIFERFYRVDKARSRQSGGTGLGLSIAEWIVKGHHGNIKVTSSPGNGSAFTVYLPKRKQI